MTDGPQSGPDAPDGGPRNRPPRDEMAALAATVGRLRDQVAALGTTVTEVSETVADEVVPAVLAQAEMLSRVRTDLDALAAEVEKPNNPPVDWFRLEPDPARAAWDALAAWVADDFVPWYEITRDQLPDCWPLHRPALLELSWLHTAHRQCYLPDSPPHVAGEWHVRWRPAALATIAAAIPATLCRPGEHLISEDDSARRRPLGRTPPAGAAPPPGKSVAAERRELATREHWEANFQHASRADVERRRRST